MVTSLQGPYFILFVCPHGAAKSILAQAACQARAREAGLDWRVEAAGTEPDAAVAPAIVEFLRGNRLWDRSPAPRRVSAAEVAEADRVVLLGCGVTDLPAQPRAWEAWDVPAPSQNLKEAWDVIRASVDRLVGG